jgi:hypothetical protein
MITALSLYLLFNALLFVWLYWGRYWISSPPHPHRRSSVTAHLQTLRHKRGAK